MKRILEFLLCLTLTLPGLADAAASAAEPAAAALKPGLADLTSAIHRDVPTVFTKTNALDDLIFAPEHQKGAPVQGKLPEGDTVFTLNPAGIRSTDRRGTASEVTVTGQAFAKALRITSTVRAADGAYNLALGEMQVASTNSDDRFCIQLSARRTSGSSASVRLYVQTSGGQRTLSQKISGIGTDWKVYYLPFSGYADATRVGISIEGGRAYSQTVELGAMQIIKLKDPSTVNRIPGTQAEALVNDLKEDAAWRKTALDNIEKVRKGDFVVEVKDNEGNPIQGAKVTMNMFEHEFDFGTMGDEIMTVYGKQPWAARYTPTAAENFNTMVSGNGNKWGYWESRPDEAKNEFALVKPLGIATFRGHTLFWPSDNSETAADPTGQMVDPALFTYLKNNDRAAFDSRVKQHIEDEIKAFPEVARWDVVNEVCDTSTRGQFYKKWGVDIYKKMFDWARAAAGPGVQLVWNDYPLPSWKSPMLNMINEFKSNDVDYDVIGLQCHNDEYAELPAPTAWFGLIDELANQSGKSIEITEFSVNGTDENLQAAYLRDMLIGAFSRESVIGFTMWGHSDLWSPPGNTTPLYANGWKARPGLEQWQDLIYNKWWTRDAEAVTDASGRAVIRGFYGDYDVTVSYGTRSQALSAAFHKGYENVLPVTMERDDKTFGIFKVYSDGKEVYSPQDITAGPLEVDYGFVKLLSQDVGKNLDLYVALYDRQNVLRYLDTLNVPAARRADAVDLPYKLNHIQVDSADAGQIGRLVVYVWQHDGQDGLTSLIPASSLGEAMVDYDFRAASSAQPQDGMDYTSQDTNLSHAAKDAVEGNSDAQDPCYQKYYESHPGASGLTSMDGNKFWLRYAAPRNKEVNYVEITGLGKDRDEGIPNGFHLAAKLRLEYTDGTQEDIDSDSGRRNVYTDAQPGNKWYRAITGFSIEPDPTKTLEAISLVWSNYPYAIWASPDAIGWAPNRKFPCTEYGSAYARYMQVAFY